MKSLRLCLFLFLLPLGFSHGQNSLFDLGFPSSKHPFPSDVGSNKVNPGIATGSSSGIYMRFGEDIAKLCAHYGISLDSSDPNKYRYPKFRLNVYATQGGFDSVKRLRYEREVQLAIVQSDLRYFAQQRSFDEEDPKKREAWQQIADEIKLVLPLYREKIHIVVRPEDKNTYKDLSDLFKKGAVVNLGTISSGGMITCAMIKEIVTRSRNWSGEHGQTWKPRYLPEDAALNTLIAKDPSKPMDAVILVGGTPYPALQKFGLNSAVKKGLFRKNVEIKPELALLPIGPEIEAILDESEFKGYHPDQIDVSEYEFMGENSEVVRTRGVYSCLVTHSSYGKSKTDHKVEWVRHVLFRILTKLDQSSETGLPHDFGSPRVGAKWKEVHPVQGINIEASWEDYYGWPRHEDEFIRKMVDVWSRGRGGNSGSTGTIIDPITLF